MQAPSAKTTRLDPFTFEVLRHRIWAINDEAAASLCNISGSPVATEIRDFNTALMNARGDAFIIGSYICSHAISQQQIVYHILKHYAENPGIGVDDVFICSDPYAGAIHQNDVTVVAPIHWNGELIAWAGATIHEIDVGGPIQGSQGSIGAQSIFGEGPPMPPLKIVEGGRLRKDIEAEYLVRSRTRELNALDLRAKLAAVELSKQRILQLVERRGVDLFLNLVDDMIDFSEVRLRARLRGIPDGTWRHESYIDCDDGKTQKLYPCRLTLTKKGDSLHFDFTGTAPQAPAVINCTYVGVLTGVMSAMLAELCYDIPWSVAGVSRVLTIEAPPGTLVNASWPAGCSKATTAGSFVATTVSAVCISRMLAASDQLRDHVMAPWHGALPTQELFGVDQRGRPFGAALLDPMAGGSGARIDQDGIDSGGFLRSLCCTIANVESVEFRYPVVYLSRRHQVDSGGAGKYRGGAGITLMYTPIDTDHIPTNVMHSYGVEQPEAVGLSGGHPCGTNEVALLRGSDVWARLEAGSLPMGLEDASGRLDVPPSLTLSDLTRGDLYRTVTGGGAGYGDPLDRDPERVRIDVRWGLVSVAAARTLYGVVVDERGLAVDVAATQTQREQLRALRLQGARPGTGYLAELPDLGSAGRIGGLSEYIDVVTAAAGSQRWFRCTCGRPLCPANQNVKEAMLQTEEPLTSSGPMCNPRQIGGRFRFRRFLCPGCGRQLETEVALAGAPVRWDVELA